MDKDSVISALQALTSGMKDRTKIAQLREVYPYIEAAKGAGFKNSKIVETLNAQGFDLTLKSFEMLLYRIREQRKTEPCSSAVALVTPSSLPTKGAHQAQSQRSTPEIQGASDRNSSPERQGPATDELAGLDKKQRRERLGDQFITPETTNPLLKRIKDHQK